MNFDRTYPQWEKYVELRHTVLRGVPTNAQLTLTLFRIGERNRTPLPPPPHAGVVPTGDQNCMKEEDINNLGK
jgi:hypothetical protein